MKKTYIALLVIAVLVGWSVNKSLANSLIGGDGPEKLTTDTGLSIIDGEEILNKTGSDEPIEPTIEEREEFLKKTQVKVDEAISIDENGYDTNDVIPEKGPNDTGEPTDELLPEKGPIN